jgi:hypothetical protein
MATRVPHAAYPANPAITGDTEFYKTIGKIAEQENGKRLVEKFDIPIRSGKAWVVKKGEYYSKFSSHV